MPARVLPAACERDEASILALFGERGLRPEPWSGGSHVRYSPHSHDYNKLLYCLGGSISFEFIETGERIDLRPGDGIELPRGTTHAAIAGPHGVTCAEAAAPSE